MPRTDLNDIVAFLAVARERSFTRASAKLGVSQPALSQTLRGLEARLGLCLLTRTTRSVAPTEADERLLRAAGPRLEEIDAELAALSELCSCQPRGGTGTLPPALVSDCASLKRCPGSQPPPTLSPRDVASPD
jgi:DNA-binding transcriptional LysR family regulator